MSVLRCPNNPIIRPEDVKPSRDDFEVIGTFNAGVTRLGDEVILLIRVAERPTNKDSNVIPIAIYDSATDNIITKEFSEDTPGVSFSDSRMIITPEGKYLTSLSHLRVAKSKDGIEFEISDTPAMSAANDYETFGLEDPRIALIDDTYYITYVAVSPLGVTTALASTKDFNSFQRHGIITCPDNKDVVIFPEQIDGKYYALHRPVTPLFEKYEMWIGESPDLKHWGNHHHFMPLQQKAWDSTKIGASATPFKIDQGWIEIYHGANEDNRYCLGAVLLDSSQPWKVIARTEKPILEPEADYEIEGFFGNVVFSCGLLHENEKLKIYYGVADTSIAYAEIPLQDVLENLKS